MTCSVRSAKSKGNQLEHDVAHSLRQKWPQTYRTAELGFVRQFDIEIKEFDKTVAIIECKRLKGISWNELTKIFFKLKKANTTAKAYVVFKSNNQPCLVFHVVDGDFRIDPFEKVFEVLFEKHPSMRIPKVG